MIKDLISLFNDNTIFKVIVCIGLAVLALFLIYKLGEGVGTAIYYLFGDKLG